MAGLIFLWSEITVGSYTPVEDVGLKPVSLVFEDITPILYVEEVDASYGVPGTTSSTWSDTTVLWSDSGSIWGGVNPADAERPIFDRIDNVRPVFF